MLVRIVEAGTSLSKSWNASHSHENFGHQYYHPVTTTTKGERWSSCKTGVSWGDVTSRSIGVFWGRPPCQCYLWRCDSCCHLLCLLCILEGMLKEQKFWEEIIAYFLYDTDPIHKRGLQHLFYCCVYICCRWYFTKSLPSNVKRIHAQTYGRDLWSIPLRWAQMSWYNLQVTQRLDQPFKS